MILTWSAALFFVASCSVEQWCATNGACYAVHAWNAPRYIAVRSHVPRAVHRVQSRGLLREPRKFKASQEFCVVTIRLGGASREPRLEKPWRACSCKRRVSFGRRPLTADNDRWNDLISRCDDYFCLETVLEIRETWLGTMCWNWSVIRRLASTISTRILEYVVSKNFLCINIIIGFSFWRVHE